MQFDMFIVFILNFVCIRAASSDYREFHGKEIGFTRVVFGFKYTHKGIVFIPSEYHGEPIEEDSMGRPIQKELAYILHLWYPGNSKSRARIRLDPFKDVVLADDFAIEADSPRALPTDVAVARGVSVLGQHHRTVPYHFVANNCGHFVAWAKYGHSQYDSQFRDRINRLARRNRIPPMLAHVVSNRVDQRFADSPTPLRY